MFKSMSMRGAAVSCLAVFTFAAVTMIPYRTGAEQTSQSAKEEKPTKQSVLRAYLRNAGQTESDLLIAAEAIAEVEREDSIQCRINASVLGGFRGNEAGKQNQFELNAEAEINIGQYPREIRVKAQTNIEYVDEALNENVKKLLVNYDYHFNRVIEIYGFVERFTDNYMSITDRYEVGFGAMINFDAFVSLGRIEEELKHYKYLKMLDLAALEDYADDELSVPAEKEIVKDFVKSAKRTETCIEARAERVLFGIAFTLFKELEEATIVTDIYDPAEMDFVEKEYFLRASRCYRGVVRPTLLWRINKQLTFSGQCYFKWALFNHDSRKISDGSCRRDWRSDLYASLEFKLPKESLFPESTSLVFTLENHYDNTPPEIPRDLKKPSSEISGNDPILAEKNHLMFNLGLKISW